MPKAVSNPEPLLKKIESPELESAASAKPIWKQLVMTGVGWGIGGAIAWASDDVMGWAISWAIFGVIGGLVVFQMWI
jgi:hypothetical protein